MMTSTNAQFRSLIKSAGITRAEAADFTRVSITTVHAWLRPEGNKAFNRCPEGAVELLRLKLANRLSNSSV